MKLLRECLGKLKLFADLELAVVDKLEDHDKRLYKLEEDYKRVRATVDSQAKTLYELQLVVADLKRK